MRFDPPDIYGINTQNVKVLSEAERKEAYKDKNITVIEMDVDAIDYEEEAFNSAITEYRRSIKKANGEIVKEEKVGSLNYIFYVKNLNKKKLIKILKDQVKSYGWESPISYSFATIDGGKTYTFYNYVS